MTMINRENGVALYIELQFDGMTLSSGTAFVVSSKVGPLLITNRHNVTGRNNKTGECLSSFGALPNHVLVSHHASGHLGRWVKKLEPLFSESGVHLWIEHPWHKNHADFVALPLTDLAGVDLVPIDLAVISPEIRVGPAEPVSVIGFPFGESVVGGFAIWATGFLASEFAFDYGGLPCALVDCRTRRGQSGSPVIAFRPAGGMVPFEDGSMSMLTGSASRFLGIYSGRINDSSDIGVFWKVGSIRQLVDSIGRPPEFPYFGAGSITVGGAGLQPTVAVTGAAVRALLSGS